MPALQKHATVPLDPGDRDLDVLDGLARWYVRKRLLSPQCACPAGFRDGAVRALRRSRRADRGPQLHQGLVQVTGVGAFDERASDAPELLLHGRAVLLDREQA